jgi:outer membrane receptor protein involved in Fe transport
VQQPNFAGNRPPFSPEYIITVGYDHIFDLGGSGKLTASINSSFKGSYFTDFYNYRDGEQESFSQTDVSLEYRPASDRFSIQAFVRNIEDERPLTYGSFVSAGRMTSSTGSSERRGPLACERTSTSDETREGYPEMPLCRSGGTRAFLFTTRSWTEART